MRRNLLAAAVLAAFSIAATGASTAAATPLDTVSLDSATVGGKRFLGRTVTQVTSSWGAPASRLIRRSGGRIVAYELRYGRVAGTPRPKWVIRFRPTEDGRLLAWAGYTSDPVLVGTSGRRLLAPWFGGTAIQSAITRELGLGDPWYGTEWILRRPYSCAASCTGLYVSGNFPRTISWGATKAGVRWLQLTSDVDVEFPAR